MISNNQIIALSLIAFVTFGSLLTIQQYAFASGCYTQFLPIDDALSWQINDVLECLDTSGSGATQLNDLTDVTLINLLNTQILKYNSTSSQWENENMTSLSDTTTCNNLGSGKILCAGGNVNIKTLVGLTGITLTNDTNTVSITNSLPESTVCNDSTGGSPNAIGLCINNLITLKKALAGTGISLSTSNSTNFIITNTLPEETTASNVITGISVQTQTTSGSSTAVATGASATNIGEYVNTGSLLDGFTINTIELRLSKTGSPTGTATVGIQGSTVGTFTKTFGTINVASLTGSETSYNFTIYPDAYTLNDGVDRIALKYTGGDGSNFIRVYHSTTNTYNEQYSNMQVDSGGVWVDSGTSDLRFRLFGNSTGIFKQESGNDLQYKSLIGSNDIKITNTTDTIKIDYNATLGQSSVDVWQSVTKTNIGNAYVDIYTVAFDMEDMTGIIHCDSITQVWAMAQMDYVGTGTISIRIVDVGDNSNVLVERTDITADVTGAPINANSPNHGNWANKPAWCSSGFKSLEIQAKSTVAGDDPIFKGWSLWVR